MILIYFFIFSFLYSQDEVQLLSPRVGTEIDVHENRFYRIFPGEKGFLSAQILSDGPDQFQVKIIKKIDEKMVQKTSLISMRKFVELQTHVNKQPELTKESLDELYLGLHFLQADKIINKIPKPQFVTVKHSGKKKLSGTLFKYENEVLFVQTPTSIEKVNLNQAEAISYRTTLGDYMYLRPYIFGLSAAFGFGGASFYNAQRNPKADVKWYNHFYGTIIGLIFSSEIFDAITTLLTPKETFILTEDEYERQRTQ
tara:strand:- start:11057 stop:11821 length:765 start_codon:yes stop_codon:yes gene_type:complete